MLWKQQHGHGNMVFPGRKPSRFVPGQWQRLGRRPKLPPEGPQHGGHVLEIEFSLNAIFRQNKIVESRIITIPDQKSVNTVLLAEPVDGSRVGP